MIGRSCFLMFIALSTTVTFGLDSGMKGTVEFEYVNGSLTSGVANLVTAETGLRRKANEFCGEDSKAVHVEKLSFQIEGCGFFDQEVEGCFSRFTL